MIRFVRYMRWFVWGAFVLALLGPLASAQSVGAILWTLIVGGVMLAMVLCGLRMFERAADEDERQRW